MLEAIRKRRRTNIADMFLTIDVKQKRRRYVIKVDNASNRRQKAGRGVQSRYKFKVVFAILAPVSALSLRTLL
jgi:hypothetical protein